jgi:hypothetical protein
MNHPTDPYDDYSDDMEADGSEVDEDQVFDPLVEALRNEDMDEDEVRRYAFADPGGNSALRAASRSNPRNLPCPTCHTPNVLTPADRRRGYQCDRCADRAESGMDGY